jgi:hypothetical protein
MMWRTLRDFARLARRATWRLNRHVSVSKLGTGQHGYYLEQLAAR